MNPKPFCSWATSASFNTVWTVVYAFRAMEEFNVEEAAFCFDVAVAGGIVFG